MTFTKIKILINGDMRKFKFDTKNQTQDDFLTKVYQLWKNNFPATEAKDYAKLVTKYLDPDQDWITFSTTDEWKEMLDDMAEKDSIKIKVEAAPVSIEDQLKKGEKKIEDFMANIFESDQAKNLMKQFQGSMKFPQCHKQTGTGKCNSSIDDIMKNLFSSFGSCQKPKDQSKPKCSSSSTTSTKKSAPKKPMQKVNVTFEKKEEKEPKVEEEKKEQPQLPTGMNGDLGNMIQSFLPSLNNAFKSYQGGAKNGQFPNFFSQGQSQKPKDAKELTTELDQLKNMGFLDEKENLVLLQKYNGDIKRVVAHYFK